MSALGRDREMNWVARSAVAAGMSSHRQTPAQTAVDIRVNGNHMPFTPFPSSEGERHAAGTE